MFDPNNPYQNVFMGQPYIRGVSTHMPQPMPGNITEPSLYPYQNNIPVEQYPQSYAEGGMVEKPKKHKKEKNNPYPSLAEMIRLQGKGEDSILAHINPLEAMMLMQIGGSGTVNPTTGLPQFGFLKGLRKAVSLPFKPFKAMMGKDSSVRNSPWVEPAPVGNDIVRYAENITAPAVPAAPVIPRKSTNEELLERFRNQMLGDQARLNSTNYVPYTGETVAPISPLTTRAQDLKNQWAARPSPYSNKIQSVLNRENIGFTPEQQQNMLEMLRRGTTSQDLATQRLNKQFGNNYGYEADRQNRLTGKIGTDIDRRLVNSGVNINNLSNELGILEGRRNANIANSFQNAGYAKEGRRNALTNQLEEFGNQERNFRNLRNQANRDAFNEEMQAPQRRLNIANQAVQNISPYISGPFEEMHPDKAAINNAQLQRIMNYYNTPYANYAGQRVVDIDPQTQSGYNQTLQFDPKYRDKFYNERKSLEKGFLTNPNLATQTYNNIPQNLEPLMANLDYMTKQQLKQEARGISGQHRMRGTYGSGVHKAQTEKAMRDILRRVQLEREGALTGVTRNQATLANEAEQNSLRKYNQMVGLGAKEFADNLGVHRNLVNSGNRQWAQKQELENAKLQNWYDQLNHELPVPDNNQLSKKYTMPV
jgi:hypothetical protein